jgi:hypothetical protein
MIYRIVLHCSHENNPGNKHLNDSNSMKFDTENKIDYLDVGILR